MLNILSEHHRVVIVSPELCGKHNNNNMKVQINNNNSNNTPSPSLNYSSNTPLSPFLKATPVPETVVQQAGDAAIVTAQYLQASLTISLNKHYKDFFKHCGASSSTVKEKYLVNLKNILKQGFGRINTSVSRSIRQSTYRNWRLVLVLLVIRV